jgi:retron-type reverse transcriptase
LPPRVKEVESELSRLSNKKSPGSDNLAPYFIKSASQTIAPFLTFLIEFMFNHGIFPNILKIAKVVPIFKTGDKFSVENYRPISLLPVFSKVIEKMIKIRMLNFLNKHNIFYDRQSGFRKNHSTMFPIIDIVSECFDKINNGVFSSVITLDLKKAFDTVNHSILLHKLDHYGIRGVCHKLLSSYLNNRKQYVCISGSISNKVDIEFGVPQGSVLGPLLFILYVNDIQNALNTSPRLFADDTCLC